MKKHKKSRYLGIVSLVTFMVATGLAIFGFSTTMTEIETATISNSPTAILASAGVNEDSKIYLSVAYFDQRSDDCINLYDTDTTKALKQRQFEWSSCGYTGKDIERGLIKHELNEKYLPVAVGGKLTPNRGLDDITSWFETTEGKNQSFTGSLKLDYTAERAEFSFHQNKFYPLDGLEFSADDTVNQDGHNHLFTMNFAAPFTALFSGNESFEITADDDTFVFIGDELVIDMGGIHDATKGRFTINSAGEVYSGVENEDLAYTGVTLPEAGANSIVRIFHADRDSSSSVFKVKFTGMNLSITDTKLANREDDGLQIAYDPTDPTYIAPLGESSVVEPDNTKSFTVIATIEGVMIIIFSLLMAASIRSVVHRKLAAREAKNTASQNNLQK